MWMAQKLAEKEARVHIGERCDLDAGSGCDAILKLSNFRRLGGRDPLAQSEGVFLRARIRVAQRLTLFETTHTVARHQRPSGAGHGSQQCQNCSCVGTAMPQQSVL